MTLRAYNGIFGDRYGDSAPTVLALHGWGRSRSDFGRILREGDAIALDLPGFGASPVPDRAGGAAAYAQWVAPILAEFDQPPVVVGHSFGGRVAVALAGENEVAGLVLVGVPLLPRPGPRRRPPLAYRVVRSARRFGLIPESVLESARHRYGSDDYRAATGVMREVLVTVVNESYREELAALRCPVRMVWGSEDHEVPVDVARIALELVADGALDVVEGAGHNVHLSHPERITAAIEEFLR